MEAPEAGSKHVVSTEPVMSKQRKQDFEGSAPQNLQGLIGE